MSGKPKKCSGACTYTCIEISIKSGVNKGEKCNKIKMKRLYSNITKSEIQTYGVEIKFRKRGTE